MNKQENNKTKYDRTISVELFNAWQTFRRRKDVEVISAELGYSRPVVDRALNFGYVKTDGLSENITEFFTKRVRNERESAGKLMSLNDKAL